MRVHVAYERDGSIVALAEIEENPTGGVACRPLPGDGQTVAEADVPGEFTDLPLSQLLSSLRVSEGSEGVLLIST
ncbi:MULTISPECIES: hypothetical protein [Streptomyces]|uniref:Uncharacterized protein n=2 Tax=Streptomyces TaxID=1883 RepID=A0A4Q9HYB7_STRKA|nr:hypothetical protein [Streptomyces kasugaensis]TBO59569.1 hypothetical protein EYS09_11375 [Streptomyces kasugaensis]WSK10651.1 hypothetical protein OG717_02090 [Streptomyces celluloflavus]